MTRYSPIRSIAVGLGVAVLTFASSRARSADSPPTLKEDFESGASRWEPTDAAAWKTEKIGANTVYSLFGASNYKPAHRSPLNIALLKDVVVGDFRLEVRVQSTKKDYNHRDICIFFGHKDPDHFYYVHFGKKTDDHANQIFIVNGADRAKISTSTTEGTNWDDEWHNVKIVRKAESGEIAVYFDDMNKPVMTAKDTTFKEGRIGLGSFDDTGNFDDLKLSGVKK